MECASVKIKLAISHYTDDPKKLNINMAIVLYYQSYLQNFPHVIPKLKTLWLKFKNCKDCHVYTDNLTSTKLCQLSSCTDIKICGKSRQSLNEILLWRNQIAELAKIKQNQLKKGRDCPIPRLPKIVFNKKQWYKYLEWNLRKINSHFIVDV